MTGVDVDRIVLVQLVSAEVDLTEADLVVDTWLDDHPEVADMVTVALVPAAADPHAGLEAALVAVEGLVSPGTAGWPGEQVAVAVGVPGEDAEVYERLLHPDAVRPWAAVVPGALPATVADVQIVVAASCLDLVRLADAHELLVTVDRPAEAQEVVRAEPVDVEDAYEDAYEGAYEDADAAVPSSTALVVLPTPEDLPLPSGRHVDLLYVVQVGAEHGLSVRRRQWLGRLLDQVAERPGRQAVRLLAVGDGISGQSPLAPAAEFRSPRRWRRRTHPWPHARGILAVTRFEQELVDMVRRDHERLLSEGLVVRDCACLVVMSGAVAGHGILGDGLRRLAQDVQFLWVAPPRQVSPFSAPFAPTVGEVVMDHPEVGEEVARKLGLRQPVFAAEAGRAPTETSLAARR